ncbi:flavodoxin family protein [Tepidibacter hydrothermalis]|uniref:Flavodoxin n=1 Tax=Tepidibacter hydrothermalis TaxID=3036126 RepID=A0ABY8EIA2_9FIRM|nr:flavodoxin [Tepidibacter hydrothermalis]WFD11665.1 flavodoxin [Tepidibacter hydrothermalis]
MKKLVIYYSFEGNTKLLSQIIAQNLDADILEINPKDEVKRKGFMKYLWGGKSVFMKEKPELEPISIDIDEYDLLIIGTPVWAGTFTPALRTFFDKYDIKNKKIFLFCTHNGGPGKTLENMKSELDMNNVIGVKDFVNVSKNIEVNKNIAEKWVEEIKYKHNI